MVGRGKLLGSLLVVLAFAGCGDMWGDLWGSKKGAANLGANGCVKDAAVIQAVMTSPPMCNPTSPCPCGTFCSSSSGAGNCLAECVDDSWCAPGKSCSPFGQCLATSSGGADGGTSTTTDPACPKDDQLLDMITVSPRSCSFTDVCPFGSSCNQQKGTCEAVCRTDAFCQAMAQPGQTLVCDCDGKCVVPTVPPVRSTTSLPSIAVTPKAFNFNTPTDLTNANWGPTASRVVSVVLVSPFVTFGATGMNVVGPTASVLANPGPGLMVQCPGASAPSAMPCAIIFDPATFKKVGDNYRSAPIQVTVAPSPAAHSVTDWSLRLDSKDVSNGPQTVTLAYRAADPTSPATGATPLDASSVSNQFVGQGTLTQTTPTGQKLRIPVKARGFGNHLVFFDETMQLSPSGKLVVEAGSATNGYQSLLRAMGPYDVALQDSLEGGVLQWVDGPTISMQQAGGRISGTFNTIIDAGSPGQIFALRDSGSFNTFQVSIPTEFAVGVATPASIGACSSNGDCVSGQTCDFGFCGQTAPMLFASGDIGIYDYLLPTSPGILRHKRMNSWGRIQENVGTQSAAGVYAPSSDPFYFTLFGSSFFFGSPTLVPPVPVISGEPDGLLSDGFTRVKPQHIPLLTQHDGTNPPPSVSTNLRDCLSELQRVSPNVNEGALPPSVLDFPAKCINMGRVDWALTGSDTFSTTLRGWLEVHSFIEREGLEEAQAADASITAVVEGSDANSSTMVPLAPIPLEQILNAGESGLGLVIDADMQNGAMYSNGLPDAWSGDYRQLQYNMRCGSDADCNKGGGQTSTCDRPGQDMGDCRLRSLADLPQHAQPAGVVPALLDTTTSYLKVLEAFLNKVARQAYGNPNEGSPNSSRRAALTRYGTGMRLALAAEATAVAIQTKNPCPGPPFNLNCPAILSRIDTARGELAAIRRRVVQQAANLATGSNPFGIPEDDIPLFFGDPTGTNSRYFAASDYLIDGWAGPAVGTAQSSLEAARQAWSAQFSAKAQDELNKHSRDQEVQGLLSKYGAPIQANCGSTSVPDGNGGTRLLESAEVIPHYSSPATPFDRQSCYISRTDDCLGSGGFNEPVAVRNVINAEFLDQADEFVSGDLPVDTINMTMTQQTKATLTVRSEICKLTGMFLSDITQLSSKNLFWAACPADIEIQPPTGTTKCVVTKEADGNLYFHSPEVNMFVPVAALEGPIRASDVGPGRFYALASRPSDIPVSSLRSAYSGAPSEGHITNLQESVLFEPLPWVDGPDDNVYNYDDVRNDHTPDPVLQCSSLPCLTSTASIADLYAESTTACGDGNGGNLNHLLHDYPLPVLGSLKASCYLGAMGVVHEEMNTAKLRITRAQQVLANTVGDLQDQFAFCKKKEFGNMQIQGLDSNLEGMVRDYKNSQQIFGVISGVVDAVKAYVTDDPNAAMAAFNSFKGAITANDDSIQDVQRKNQELEGVIARGEDIAGCWDSFRATRRSLDTAMSDISIALSELDEKSVLLTGMEAANELNLQEGTSVWNREKDSPLPSLSHEFWIDEKIERFKTEFEWSRRLTFLAMRAVEYEFQQTLPFRAAIVAATNPNQLEDVVLALKQEQASRTINRRRPEEASIVVSLRDDILGISDRSSEGQGERNWTPAERFAARLWDPTYAVRDSNGNWQGQGIPFSLGPTGILETRCGERMWRATATLQGDGIEPTSPGAPVLLLKRNTFSSQFCNGKGPTAATGGSSLQTGVIHPSAELFRPGANVDLSDAGQFSAAMLYPWFNIRKADFYKATYQDGASEELAGRGLYGDYVMLFPKEMLTDSFSLDKVEDVLLRIDYLSVDNLTQ